MRTYLRFLLLLLIPTFGNAQQSFPDSLKQALKTSATDSARISLLGRLAEYYHEIDWQTALHYDDLCIAIAKENNRAIDEACALGDKGYTLIFLGKYPESLQCLQQALTLAEDPKNENSIWYWNPNKDSKVHHKGSQDVLSMTHFYIGILMGVTNNVDQVIFHFKATKKLAQETGNIGLLGGVNMNLGAAYLNLNKLDSALVLSKNAEQIFNLIGFKKFIGNIYLNIGYVYLKKGDKNKVLQYFHKALNEGIGQNNFATVDLSYAALTNYYLSEKQKDSSLYYAKKRLGTLRIMKSNDLGEAYENLYQSYKLDNKHDSTYKYQGLALAAKDSSYKTTLKSLADFQRLTFKEQLRLQELEKEKEDAQTRIKTYALLVVIGVFMLLAGTFYRNYRQKQRANVLLNQQKEEVQSALSQLKSTQTQLIQSEKMASLGELTAGIAHEIQNPLNFVNNFSEVSIELLNELKEEEEKGSKEDVIAIADNLTQNLEKIRHHGKRADAIVKGMLQHSQSSSGKKEPVNINSLADEYLRLSYQGFRAKDKSFNAETISHFDPNLPKVNIIPQDMGRALLNLFNNAFYAVSQKQKTAGTGYKPEVTITTSAENGQIIIKVQDNGVGIPPAIKDKIMQPFFTTKPTGEGTGLGLSLTYDIVVKGHGGNILVNSKEGEGSEFIIKLTLT